MPIPFNKGRAKEFAASATIAPGGHALCFVAGERHYSKKEENDNLMARYELKKIVDPEDEDTIVGKSVSYWTTFPLDNPEVDGHEVPQWAGRMFQGFAAAVNPELPEWPHFDKDEQQTYFKGEPIEKGEQVDQAKLACIMEAGEYASELWGEDGDNVDSIVGTVVYGEVEYEEGSDFPRVGRLYREPPEGFVITDEIIRQVEMSDVPEPTKRTTKKKAKKKGKK